MNIKIKTLSYLLVGSGTNTGLIDTDIAYHRSGFPFIPGKRIKGLLRESLLEVLEMYGIQEDSIVAEIFGSEGNALSNKGLIRVGNAYLRNWEELIKEVFNHPNTFSKENISTYFTTDISQTTIDEKTGIAKDRSLRSYRVLNPGFEFILPVSFRKDLDDNKKELFRKAVLNLRYMGTRRNRGFGKVRCRIDDSSQNGKTESKKESIEVPSFPFKLMVSAKTLNPVILSQSDGDQNTVSSERFINGNKLRGVLVNRYKQEYGKIKDGDPLFYELFLSGRVRFGNLMFEGNQVMPLNLHYPKDRKNEICNVFNAEGITKPLKGYGILKVKNQTVKVSTTSPKITSNFHTQRGSNRSAGTSTEEEGSIFYYSAIEEGQNFIGEITGEQDTLKKLIELLTQSLIGYLGKSKSAQYGRTVFTFEAVKVNEDQTDLSGNKFNITLSSPSILINDLGVAEPSETLFKKYLEEKLGTSVEIKNRAIALTDLEQFNVIWNARTEKIAALEAGSVFEIYLNDLNAIKRLNQLQEEGIGELKNIGYGKVVVSKANSKLNYEWMEKDSSNKNSNQQKSKCEIKNPLLKDIKEFISKNNRENLLKSNAISDAISSRINLNNHQLGIMIQVFTNAKNSRNNKQGFEYIKDWLDKSGKISENKKLKKNKKQQREPKPVFIALQKAGLVNGEDLEKSKLLKKTIKEEDNDWTFKDGFTYWKAFFQTMQKKNNQQK